VVYYIPRKKKRFPGFHFKFYAPRRAAPARGASHKILYGFEWWATAPASAMMGSRSPQ